MTAEAERGHSRRRTWIAIGLFLISAAVYAGPGRNGGTADTFPAQLLPITLLGEGNLDFNEFVCPFDADGVAIAYDASRCLAPLPYYLNESSGRVVSRYPIVPGLLNLPAHLVASAIGVDVIAGRGSLALVTAACLTGLAVALFFLALEAMGFARATALLAALVLAFGTLAWSVAGRGLWQHGPSLLLLSAALLGLARGTRRDLIAAGFLLGLAVFNRPTNVLLLLPLAWYVARAHREAFLHFAIAAAVPLAAMALYSQLMFGSVMALGQGQRMRFTANPLEGIAGVLVSPSRGLFIFSPVLLLGLLAIPRLVRERNRAGASEVPRLLPSLLAGTAGVIVVHGLWAEWWGGHSFGYRLVTEALPGGLALLALSWETHLRGHRWRVAAASLLLAWSVAANALGALVAPCGFDTVPNPVDLHPERLWDVRDSELVRCVEKVLGD